jgi:SAM-dependent methyltransferase
MNPEAYLEMAETESRHWWFHGRRQILERLITQIKLKEGAKILEIGSGTGGNLDLLSRFGAVSAMEMDSEARAIATRKTGGRFNIRAGSCPDDLPFPGEKFDLICLFDVLEHIEQDRATLEALKPLLAQGGLILLTVPAYAWLWSVHDEYLHHKRRYTAPELRQKALGAGYRITRLAYFNTLLFPLAAVARIKDKLLGSTSASGAQIPPAPLNSLLGLVFGLERFILDYFDPPFGVSLLCLLRLEDSR